MKSDISECPVWAREAFVYQVFPDRFRRSFRVEAQSDLAIQHWGSQPSLTGFQGGDLYGVIDRLDYFQDFGVNCLYLTPVFSSASNHRYHTYDYLNVDPLLGGNDALDELIEEMHSRGMKLILDGVFNHCGRGFWAFHHLLENGDSSPYRDWFHVHRWPLNPYSRTGKDCGYSCWWNNPALPKFNHANSAVREYLLNVSTHWVSKGIDGWRLDVPDEVPFLFWKDFRAKVKALNPEAWIVGEIWGDARRWLNGGCFDGVMNYRVGWSSLSWVAGKHLRRQYKNNSYPLEPVNSQEFIRILKTTLGWYSSEVNKNQLNLLDSHDVPRALHTLKGDIGALKLALLLLFLQPGAVCLYYGTEIGLDGGADPNCREAFPWEGNWLIDLRGFLKSLFLMRKEYICVLERGLVWDAFGEDGLYGRAIQSEKNLSQDESNFSVLLNRSRRSWLKVEKKPDNLFLLVGKYEERGRGLAPQSAMAFN